MAASTFREGALKTSAANPIASNWSRGRQLVLDQPAQDLRGLPAQGLFGVGNAGTLVFALAFGKHRTAMPTGARRHRRRPGNNVAALLVAREVDDVLHWPYDFLNHWNSRDRSADVMTESRRANVQSSAQILAERLRGGVREFRVLS